MEQIKDLEQMDYQDSGFSFEENNHNETEPFDPQKISITKKNIALDVIIRRIKQNTIILSPDFQRNIVWNDIQKSRLIESLMLNIPIPMFYVAAKENGYWTVVDGLQRLTAIREFVISKKLLLKDLEYWQDFNGKSIDDLPPIIYNRIFETEFTFAIVEPDTPDNVKYNIFKRINTGGNPLNNQEIRNALYNGGGTNFIKKLASSEVFLNVTNNSIKDKRMIAQECVLRFISFLLVGKDGFYEKDNLDSFLIRTLKLLNTLNKKKDEKELNNIKILVNNFNELERLFYLGLLRNKDFFGNNAFRLMSINTNKRTPINRALLETFGTLLAKLSNIEFEKLLSHKTIFLEKYEKIRVTDEFYRAVSRDPCIKKNIDYRFNILANLIYEAIND